MNLTVDPLYARPFFRAALRFLLPLGALRLINTAGRFRHNSSLYLMGQLSDNSLPSSTWTRAGPAARVKCGRQARFCVFTEPRALSERVEGRAACPRTADRMSAPHWRILDAIDLER